MPTTTGTTTTGMTTRTTTEEPPPRARGRRIGLSVRTRITATVAVLVTIALSAAGGLIYALEMARLEQAALTSAQQELDEFATLRDEGTDPETGRPFANETRLLQLFLERNVPDTNEIFVGWYDDQPRIQRAGSRPALVQDPEFERAVRADIDGGQVKLETSAGEVLLTVQPVRTRTARGDLVGDAALVLVTLLDASRTELASLMRTYAVVALLSLGAITALAAWQAGRLLDPLRQLNDAARQISVTDLSLRIPERGNDDITALTVTFNRMLERLERAFVGQRRFLDEAGHELRTPLTVLRGHLELLDPDRPDDVEETRELLLDEIDRMSRLVGDMILLAKSSRPDFLELGEVRLESLTPTLVAKATALGDRDWELDAAAQGTVMVDEQRLTQAVLQLAGNAVKHTDPGAAIAIGSTCNGQVARLWVRDTGDGVPPANRELIFERFGRGPVRPGDEGFGLGLSIVRAIAEAHGGSLDLAETPPPGATFVITLPVTAQDNDAEEPPWPAS